MCIISLITIMVPNTEEKKVLAEKIIMILSEMKNNSKRFDDEQVSEDIEEI